MINKDKIHSLWQRKGVRQVASLFSVNIVGIPLGIVTNIIVTRYLGPQLFGDYKFICTIFTFAALLASFGFFQAGNRVLVQTTSRLKAQNLYGAILVIWAFLSVLMMLGLYVYSAFDSNIASKGLLPFFYFIVPLSSITLWGTMYEAILPADNQIGMLAKLRLYPKLINVVAALVLLLTMDYLSINKLLAILLLYQGTQFLIYLYITIKVKPLLKRLKPHLNEILQSNRTFGFNVYIGSLCAVGFTQLTAILISYFGTDNVAVGFYTLACTFTQPLSIIPSTIAVTHYKSYATSKSIPRKLTLTTIALSTASVVGLWILVPPFIKYYYGEEFLPVVGINFIVCFGTFFHGLADFYNRFLQANGKGIALRNASFIVGLSHLASSLLFIPKFGAYGAAYANVTSGLTYLCVILYYYKRLINEKRRKQV